MRLDLGAADIEDDAGVGAGRGDGQAGATAAMDALSDERHAAADGLLNSWRAGAQSKRSAARARRVSA